MGNRISDIGKMRSGIAADGRITTFTPKKLAKLGSEKNPASIRVQSDARLKELRETFENHGWQYRVEVAPDKPEEVGDLERLLNPQKPTVVEKKVGRNEPCLCGSGKKFKNCCGK
jgi:SWIM/SEC-C metal-binding protein